ncbi:serine hydrolase domain-containing protein [Rummeliibacillus pycnus]|uniref:serine hydrolase domain-containing protein n=1 Tax=Rummeliibacillus pycnus TaxID=101070 RepID=UPI001FE68FF8|nr:serine hydrolase domain-containing protein [Rummeliibacillus pycnus]
MKKRLWKICSIGMIIAMFSLVILDFSYASKLKKIEVNYQYDQFSWDHPGSSSQLLHDGQPKDAGMVEEPLNKIDQIIQNAINQKVMPGAVVSITRKGTTVKEQAYGYAYRYLDDQYTESDEPILMQPNTIFDIASISKVFTTIAAMQLYEKGKFQLDEPVAKYIPEFAENGKKNVTIRQLMTHTSGFDQGIDLYKKAASREERLEIVLKHSLSNPPNSKYTYSDLNMITLGVLVERLTGKRLDEYVKQHIIIPLGMKDTMYNPPASLQPRIAATEYQPWTERGIVWGQVHDENAWALGGVAGHAGVFSTAHDLTVLGQMLLKDGTYDQAHILKPSTVKLMEQNMNQAFPGNDHGLGFDVNQGWYMDGLTDVNTIGHTGFTGASLVISPKNKTIVILLTNRVHPTRNTLSINQTRRLVARQAADAIPVAIPGNKKAWFAGYGDKKNAILQAEVNIHKPSVLHFLTWYRMEKDADIGKVEISLDGTTWNELGLFTGTSDQWQEKSYQLPAGTKFIRFQYITDSTVNERGWYVLKPQVKTDQKNITPEFTSTEWETRNR